MNNIKIASTLVFTTGVLHLIIDFLFIGLIFIFRNGSPFFGGPPSLERIFFGIFVAIIFTGMGIMLIISSKWIKNPKTQDKGAVVSLVLGILNIGIVIGFLAIIGGIMALLKNKNNNCLKKS
ncbi:MAG: hypothetical protein KAS02_01080 [Candidatus Pacebacteria bacterium]|nr:hypothetical protein [Candidatus Paceibacterota bacterium]